MRTFFYFSVIVLLAFTAALTFIFSPWYLLLLLIILPYMFLGIYDCIQTGNNVNRNYPIVGHLKSLLVNNRELIQDWVIENEQDIRPFDRIQRNIVYHRAGNMQQTVAFGTRYDYYKAGYEWLLHSNYPVKKLEGDLRVTIGGTDCSQPYSCSILNVGGMSYGSISRNATMALNGGARLGNFASNTGEGGLTEYHLKYGGDLIFQFGTGYFGCRNSEGEFDEKEFSEKAKHQQVKMIEVKISQGAKPGYGAILPGKKVTEEIARIRGIKKGVTVFSPPAHTIFHDAHGLMYFIQRLRKASGGKPVGYKFCIGNKQEVIDMCKAMVSTGITPDFISIDGGEGGTGAAHYESADRVGMPLEDALAFASNVLSGFSLKDKIKLFASGKIINAFDIVKYLSLGADACYSARGMMFALGCVQALQCDRDTCPTGVTTMNESLMKGLVAEDKKNKVFNFHRLTIEAVKDLLSAAGWRDINEIDRRLICRRTRTGEVKNLREIYPDVEE